MPITADDLINARMKELGIQDEPSLDIVRGPEDSGKLPYVTGDLARALAPKLPAVSPNADQLIYERQTKIDLGRRPTLRIPLAHEDQIIAAEKAPPDADQLIAQHQQENTFSLKATLSDVGSKLYKSTMGEESKVGPTQFSLSTLVTEQKKQIGEGAKKALQSPVGRTMLYVLGASENLEVAGLRKVSGLPAEKDWLNNTYTNLYKDWGAPDDLTTDAMGLATSLLTGPGWFLKFGKGPAAINIAKDVTLTEKGLTAAAEIASERTGQELASLKASVSKTKGIPVESVQLGDDAVNRVAKRNFEQVKSELTLKFRGIQDEGQKIKVSPAVDALPDSVFNQGGIQFAGKTVISGQNVAKIVDDLGLPDLIQAASQSKAGQYLKTNVVDPFTQELARTKDLLGKFFIKKYKVDEGLKNVFEDAQNTAKTYYERNLKSTEKWMTRYGVVSPEQRTDFFNSIDEAFGKGDLVGQVKSKSGDTNVQRAIDRWLGQGEFEGRNSVTDKLAQYAKLADGEEQPGWIPHIANSRLQNVTEALQIPDEVGPATRAFNKAREGFFTDYTRDPVKAIAYRRTQVAIANIQDRIFENIQKAGLGDPKKFGSLEEALAEGYVPLTRGFGYKIKKELLTGEVEKAAKTSEMYFVKKEFYDQYRELVRSDSVYVPFLSWFTNVQKAHLTSTFPAFHAANFTSNIVQNAMIIGRHEFNPKYWKLATQLSLGNGMDTEIVTNIGEKLTLKNVLTEMESQGLLNRGAYVADLAGSSLPGEAKNLWLTVLNRTANPMSLNWQPLRWGRSFGNAIENQAKAINYLTWRMKGLSPSFAAHEVTEALFDYSALTRGEQWLKHFILFYSYSRKNFELSAKVFAHRPAVLGAMLKTWRDLGPTQDEWEGIPDYLKDKIITRFGGSLTRGWRLPIEDLFESLNDPLKKASMMLNPIVRHTFEKKWGQDIFMGRPIEHINSADEFKWVEQGLANKNMPASVIKSLKMIHNFFEIQDDPDKHRIGHLIGNPDKLHFLRNFWTSRYQSTIGAMQKEDQSTKDIIIRATLGLVRVEPDPELQFNNQKRKQFLEQVRKINSANVARGIPMTILVGGQAFERNKAQKVLERTRKAKTPEQLDLSNELLNDIIDQHRDLNRIE